MVRTFYTWCRAAGLAAAMSSIMATPQVSAQGMSGMGGMYGMPGMPCAHVLPRSGTRGVSIHTAKVGRATPGRAFRSLQAESFKIENARLVARTSTRSRIL